jgi:hypothetical protein
VAWGLKKSGFESTTPNISHFFSDAILTGPLDAFGEKEEGFKAQGMPDMFSNV